jgi:hypothetical protein
MIVPVIVAMTQGINQGIIRYLLMNDDCSYSYLNSIPAGLCLIGTPFFSLIVKETLPARTILTDFPHKNHINLSLFSHLFQGSRSSLQGFGSITVSWIRFSPPLAALSLFLKRQNSGWNFCGIQL